MFRIHAILVWIRIRGSIPLTNGSRSVFGFGSGSCYFHHWPSRRQQKIVLEKSFTAYYFWKVGTFTSFFKDKKSKRSHKTVGIKVFFSYYFCLMIEGSGAGCGSIPLTKGSGSEGPKTCGSGGSGTLVIRYQMNYHPNHREAIHQPSNWNTYSIQKIQ